MARWTAALLATAVLAAGCRAPRDANISIDRRWVTALGDHPAYADLGGRYDELMYLARIGDPDAIGVIIRLATSDRMRDYGGPRIHDLLAAACSDGNEGTFWAYLPQLPAERQARAILVYGWLNSLIAHPEGDPATRIAVFSIVDWETDRDAYFAQHPEVRRRYLAAEGSRR
jgi:hypothetical protein